MIVDNVLAGYWDAADALGNSPYVGDPEGLRERKRDGAAHGRRRAPATDATAGAMRSIRQPRQTTIPDSGSTRCARSHATPRSVPPQPPPVLRPPALPLPRDTAAPQRSAPTSISPSAPSNDNEEASTARTTDAGVTHQLKPRCNPSSGVGQRYCCRAVRTFSTRSRRRQSRRDEARLARRLRRRRPGL
jgi:hypothetical protein